MLRPEGEPVLAAQAGKLRAHVLLPALQVRVQVGTQHSAPAFFELVSPGHLGQQGPAGGCFAPGDFLVFERNGGAGLNTCDLDGEIASAAFEVRRGEQAGERLVLARLLRGGGLEIVPQVS